MVEKPDAEVIKEIDGVTIQLVIPSAFDVETHDQTVKFAKVLAEALVLFSQKQNDYGRQNIAKHGELGVAVRLGDKEARLANLLFNPDKAVAVADESLEGTWIDVLNYGGIGLLTHRGEW